MTKQEFKDCLDDEMLRQECCHEHGCIYCLHDVDSYPVTDDYAEEHYEDFDVWQCEALNGDFCPRLGRKLEFED